MPRPMVKPPVQTALQTPGRGMVTTTPQLKERVAAAAMLRSGLTPPPKMAAQGQGPSIYRVMQHEHPRMPPPPAQHAQLRALALRKGGP